MVVAEMSHDLNRTKGSLIVPPFSYTHIKHLDWILAPMVNRFPALYLDDAESYALVNLYYLHTFPME